MIHRSFAAVGITLLLVALFAGRNAAAQQPPPRGAAIQKQEPNFNNKAILTPPPLAPPQKPPVVSIKLSADRASALAGEDVIFSLDPAQNVVKSRYVFTIDFGDDNKQDFPADQAAIEHAYKEPGTFPVSVALALRKGAEDYGSNPVIANSLMFQVNPVTLEVHPANTVVDQAVTLETPFRTTKPDIRYRFIAGDEADPTEAPVTDKPAITHTYTRSGTFMAQLQIGRLVETTFVPMTTTKTVPVRVSPAAALELQAFPANPKVGQAVSFTITYPPDGTDLRYRVVFGDDSDPSVWDTTLAASHTYRSASTYAARAEVGRFVGAEFMPFASSAEVLVTIVAVPELPVWPWILLIAVGVTSFAVHQYRKSLPVPHPILEAYPDATNSNPAIEPIPIEVQIRLIRGIPDGQYDLETEGPNLIKARRKKHG